MRAGLTRRCTRRSPACGCRPRVNSNVRRLFMQECPSCRASLSLGATDCAVCGCLVASTTESRPSRPADLLAVGTAGALWVAVTSTVLIWFYPIFVFASLFAGLAIGRLASRQAPWALSLLVVPLGLAALWLLHAASANPGFGSGILTVGFSQVALLTVPALVWPRHKP